MDQFFANVSEALCQAGLPAPNRQTMARRYVSEVETALTRPEAFAARLRDLQGRLREVIAAAVGAPVRRLLITPVPDYVIACLPEIIAEFDSVVLADNFKSGIKFGGLPCISLDEALVDIENIDACLLATVDQRLGRRFRDRLPEAKTVAAGDLSFADSVATDAAIGGAVVAFEAAIRSSVRPLVVLAAYLDATVAPTLDALGGRGFDVFIVTRRSFSTADTHAISDPVTIAAERHIAVDLTEMLWLLGRTADCPVIVNYARFYASLWDMRNTLPLFAYSIAVLRAIAGVAILHLYDAYQVCLRGFEDERSSFALYRELLDRADGILVNSGAAPVLRELLGPDKPVIGFLRYGPDVVVRQAPEPGPFSIAMITSFVGEADDPTRMTGDAVRCLLQQSIHVHYYSSHAAAKRFADALPAEEGACFHLHEAIRDQGALVAEISRWHAGWFVADMTCCEALEQNFTTPFAQTLARQFVPTAVGTAGILYGCAGLPSFFNRDNHGAALFPTGGAIEISLDEVADVGAMIARRDWSALRQEVAAARRQFTAGYHAERLAGWLLQFYGLPGSAGVTAPSP